MKGDDKMLTIKQAKLVCDYLHKTEEAELKEKVTALIDYFPKQRDKNILKFYLSGYDYIKIASLFDVAISTIYRRKRELYSLVRAHITEEDAQTLLECFERKEKK